jgi:heat shock protein HslJ
LAEKRVMGNSGCNSFNGNFEWTGKKLTFGPLMSTRMLCAQADSIETKIMGTLSDKMINYKLEGLKLTISDGKTSLVYKKVD